MTCPMKMLSIWTGLEFNRLLELSLLLSYSFTNNVYLKSPIPVFRSQKIAFNLSSASAFNLDQLKMLSFGKELTLYHTITTFNELEIEAF